MHPLQYGPDPGNLSTRRALAKLLARLYGAKCSHSLQPEERERRIALTGGASGALSFVLQLFTDQKSKAVVLEPTYFFAKGVLEDAGFRGERLIGAPWKGFLGGSMTGLVDAVKEALAKSGRDGKVRQVRFDGGRKIFDYVLYISGSTFNNPTGMTIPESERTALIHFARKTNMLIISDDVYDFLSYPEASSSEVAPARFVDLDVSTQGTTRGGNTLSNGSWSKIFGGGIRSGWIETADELVAEAYAAGGATKSGGDMGHFASCIIEGLLEGEEPAVLQIIEELRDTFGKRARAMVDTLRRELLDGSVVMGGEGGFFLWVGLGREQDRLSAQEVADRAGSKSLRLLSVEECIVGEELKGSRWMRLSVCWEEQEQAIEGCKRLAQVTREMTKT